MASLCALDSKSLEIIVTFLLMPTLFQWPQCLTCHLEKKTGQQIQDISL